MSCPKQVVGERVKLSFRWMETCAACTIRQSLAGIGAFAPMLSDIGLISYGDPVTETVRGTGYYFGPWASQKGDLKMLAETLSTYVSISRQKNSRLDGKMRKNYKYSIFDLNCESTTHLVGPPNCYDLYISI